MAKSADSETLKQIRRLASDPDSVMVTKTVEYDLMGHHLTRDDICDEIIQHIDDGERVKPTVMRGRHDGQTAYEMTPRINDRLFYIKVLLIELEEPDEHMLLISAHPSH